MSTQVQYRRGTSTENNAFTGALAEITVDTTNWTLRVHDGVTAGGQQVIVGTTASQALTNKSYAGSTASLTGNITGGNVNTGGLISATGNLIASGIALGTGNIIGGNITATHYGSGAGLSSITGANVTGTVSSATTAATVTTAAQPNITSVGTLSSVTVTGNVVGGNINTAGLITATGNITGGNISGTRGSFTNIVGTLETAAQPNITSVGTLSSVSISGNVIGGNVNTAGLMSATGSITSVANITGGNLITAGNVNAPIIKNGGTGMYMDAGFPGYINFFNGTANPTVTIGDAGSLTAIGNIVAANVTTAGLISATGNITGGNVNTNTLNGTGTTIKSAGNINLSATGNIILSTATYINNLSTPVQDADAANKGYVDSVAQGLDIKASVVWATVAALPAYTYNNGTSGVGATITGNANGALSIDGNAVSATQRVLVKNETSTNAPYNGIYVVTNAGSAGAAYVLTRATDFDNGTPSGEMPGAFTFVENGTLADTGWVCTTDAPITVGTTNIVFAQFSGAGTYSAGTGLTLTGTTFSVNASQTQITTVGTLGSLSVTGSTTSGNLLTGGNVSATGNITGGNILGGANVNATTHTGGTVSVTGDVNGGNLISAALVQGVTVSASGNVIGGNINTAGLMSATGQVTGSQFNGSGAGLTSIPAGNLSGTTLNSGVVTSSLTTVGALNAGSITSGFGAIDIGIDTITCGGIVNANANGIGNIGSSSVYFNTVFGKATTAQYADLAENYSADIVYAPGTVLDFGGSKEVTISAANSTRVAGVVSTNPAHLMNSMLDGDCVVALALTGRVPTSVVGTVRKGDMMVSAGNGLAQACATPSIGTVIGKALENFDGETGVIEVVVGRL